MHNTTRQLDPSKQPQQQNHAPHVNARGRVVVSGSSGFSPSPYSRKIDNGSPSLTSQDEAIGNRSVNSYPRRNSREYDQPQPNNSSSKVKRVVGKGNETHKSWNDRVCESESRSTDDDCSSIDDDHTSLTPNSENDNQPRVSNTQRQRKLVSPVIDDAAQEDFIESRFSNKHITSAYASRSYGTNSKYSTSSHRKNGDAFSSSSNGTSSEEEDNDIPMMTGPQTSTVRQRQRYPRNNTNDTGSSTTNDDKVNNIQSSSSAPSQQLQQPRDSKFTIMLQQRKLARDSRGTGHVSTGAAGSAFDQALEQVKTSSNISTAASSSLDVASKSGSNTASKALVPSHLARRSENGAVIGSFHLSHPDSPSLSTQKSITHKEKGSIQKRERELAIEGSTKMKKTNISVVSTADAHVINDSYKLDESNSPVEVDSVQVNNITERDSFDEILSIPNITPKNAKPQSISSQQTLPIQDSVKADQKLSYRNSSSITSSMQLTYDSMEGSTSAAAFETSSLPSAISSAGTQTSNTLTGPLHQRRQTSIGSTSKQRPKNEDLASGVLPDVLMTMREKLESLSLFDSDMMKFAQPVSGFYNVGINGKGPFEEETEEERLAKESLQRSFQQSISAAVLVSLAHKRYERRRLAAMEVRLVFFCLFFLSFFKYASYRCLSSRVSLVCVQVEKIVRSLVAQNELERYV